MLVGSPRSGTTWLQAMLAAHPEIASPQETDIFQVYVKPLLRAWDIQLQWQFDGTADARRPKGLPLVLTERQFLTHLRGLVDSMVDEVSALKPSATVILEKSPAHSRCVHEITRVAPETSFIHIIRDGRDVAASLVAASEDGWGSRWAPTTIADAARVWREHLLAARDAMQAPGGYHEVRYEDLRGEQAERELAAVFLACGVTVNHEECAEIIRSHNLDLMRSSGAVSSSILTGGELGGDDRVRREPQGFFRSAGAVDGWRNLWSDNDRRSFNAVAGPLLAELGYAGDDEWIGAKASFPIHQRLATRASGIAGRTLRSWAASIEELPRRFG